MATTAQNRSRKDNKYKAYPKSSSFAFNQGDLMYWDPAVPCMKALDSDAHAATAFIGQSQDTNPVQDSLDITGVVGASTQGIVQRAGIVSVIGTTGETYIEGQALYWATDAQHVTNVAGANILGYYVTPENGTAQAAIAAGTEILMELQILFPFPTMGIV